MTQATTESLVEETKMQCSSVLISVLDFREDFSSIAEWLCEYRLCSTDSAISESTTMSLTEAYKAAAALQAENENLAVSVVLPAELAALQNVSLPSKKSRQVMQALPFVVEEQLAVDIETVHLAVGVRQADATWPVIVIDVAVMAALRLCCEQHNLRLSAVYVDAQLLPVASNGLTIALCKKRVLVRTEKNMAVFDLVSAAEMVDFFLAGSEPAAVNIFYSSEDEAGVLLAQKFATEFSALGDSNVEIKSDAHTLAPLLFSWINATSINLLQGKFFVKPLSGKLPIWRWLAAVAVFFWLGQCTLQVASGWYFNHSADALEAKMDAQFRKLLPDARRVGGVRKQLESLLMESGGDGSANAFAEVFSASIQALNAMPNHQGVEIIELRYDDAQAQLEFELKAKSIEQLDQYKQALSKAGLSAKISSANEGGSGVEGRMQISKSF